jgi:hypothetical protein
MDQHIFLCTISQNLKALATHIFHGLSIETCVSSNAAVFQVAELAVLQMMWIRQSASEPHASFVGSRYPTPTTNLPPYTYHLTVFTPHLHAVANVRMGSPDAAAAYAIELNIVPF